MSALVESARMSVATTSRKIVFLLTVGLIVTGYLTAVATEYMAGIYADRLDLASQQHAVSLQPENARYRYMLGRGYAFGYQDSEKAIPWFQSAVALNPHVGLYWMGLASACGVSGRPDCQLAALQNAIRTDPRSPSIAWEAANFYVSRGEIGQAISQFAVTVQTDDYRTGLALQECLRITDLDTILREVMPEDPQPYYELLDLLIAKHQAQPAYKVWEQLVSLQQPLQRSHVFELVHYLIADHRIYLASQVWSQSANLAGLSAYQPSPENLVVNGDFSLDVLNAGFDWQHQALSGISLALDPTEVHSGNRSLQIRFATSGIADAGIRQIVPVQPNRTYRFSAYFKTENLESAGGPRFAVEDLYTGKLYLSSDELTDADFWKPVNGVFTTDSSSHAVAIHIQRDPAGSPIRGKLWIDGVRLEPNP